MIASRLLIMACLTLAACGSEGSSSHAGDLRSDFPLQTTDYYVQNASELAKMDGICTAWKGSQRPPLSWPSVVVSNCNNVDAAKGILVRKTEQDKLLKEAGN